MARSGIGEGDMTALAAQPPQAVQDVDWIVCRGAERQVVTGRVACPLTSSSGMVAIETCLLCRHLIATPIDRLPEGMCSTGLNQESSVRWSVL